MFISKKAIPRRTVLRGAGAMLALPDGAISYSIYVPDDFVRGMSFAESYEMFDSWVIGALGELGVNAWYQGLNDITSDLGKLGGAAQARKHGAVLHHTTIAYRLDGAEMARVLRIGREKLSDKGIASAAKRVHPLVEQLNHTREEVVAALTEAFRARFPTREGTIHPAESAAAAALVINRYATDAWTLELP